MSARPIYHAIGGLMNQAEPPVKECPSFIRVQLVFLPELLGVEHLGQRFEELFFGGCHVMFSGTS